MKKYSPIFSYERLTAVVDSRKMNIIRNPKQKDAPDLISFCGKQWNEGSARAVLISERM